MNALVASHLGAAILATAGVCGVRAYPLGAALASVVAVDLSYVFAWGWPQGVLVALVGPASVIAASLLTFHTPKRHTVAIVAPVVLLAPYVVLDGPRLGSAGIAWLLVAAHLYAATIGLVVITLGHEQTHRLHVRLVGLFVATSAPSAFGWTCRALGASMRPAAVLDCVFLAACVVWSVAAWTTRPGTYFSPPSSARCSGR